MTAEIYDAAGNRWALPVLLHWDFSYGFCKACDCFEAAFLYDAAMLPALRAACRFRAEYEGKTVFFGVVDEVELRADGKGATAALRGRGLQALLLDSEAESADYYGVDAAFLLEKHILPFGVTEVDVGDCGARRASFSVSSGESHWSVVQRFAEFCCGTKPRFTPEGHLLLDGAKSGETLRIDARSAVTAQTFAQERYGVISSVIVKNRSLGSRVKVENAEFIELGGASERVVNVPRKTGFDAMRHTASYQIAQSGADFVRCRLTLPQRFAAFPGDTVELNDSPLGVRGTFFVAASRCRADASACATELDLRQDYLPTLKNG